jgi:hypothetical protein
MKELGVTNLTPILINRRGFVKFFLLAFVSLYQTKANELTMPLDTSLGELAMMLNSKGYIPGNSHNQCNPCRTFSTPSGMKEYNFTLRELNLQDGGQLFWTY